jgi:hypothetical protein
MMNTQLSSLTRITYSTAYKCEASSAMVIFPTAYSLSKDDRNKGSPPRRLRHRRQRGIHPKRM